MIELHKGQTEVFNAVFKKQCRTVSVNASRGWGKSYAAATMAVKAAWELMELDISVPNKNVYIIAPTHSQASEIYYPLLQYELGMESYAKRSLKTLGKFIFPKHVEIRLASYEAIERMRGKGAYFVVNDELSSWKDAEEAVQSIIQPCVTTRWSQKNANRYGAISPGRMVTISTPKGYNTFYDMYNDAESKFTYDYTTSPYLDPDEIERIRHTIDPIKFASEYLAQFKESGINVFYMFDRDKHVVKDLPDLEESEDIHCCIDFNVGRQCTGFFAIRGGQMHFLDEFQGMPDTEQLAIAINGRYSSPHRKIHVYPDPTGKSRKTSAKVGVTDLSILSDHGLIVHARNSSPGLVDSVNAVNKQLLTASGVTSMYFHPRCKGMIKSMERTKWVDNNSNTATIDKSENIEHYSDGIRYATEFLFPVLKATRTRVGQTF